MAKTVYLRHEHGDQWYRAKEVTKPTEVETPWGSAWAEIGTYILTLKGDPKHQVICTEADLESMTTEKAPTPVFEDEQIQDPAYETLEQILPGMDNYAA